MEQDRVLGKVQELKRALRRKRALEVGCVGLAWGGGLAVALSVLYKLLGWSMPDLLWAAVPFPLLALLLGGWERFKPVSSREVALAADARLGLKERLSTSLEWIEQGHTPTLMSKALLKDVGERLPEVQPSLVFPLRLPRALRSLVITLPLMAAVWAAPTVKPPRAAQAAAQNAAIQRAATHLAQTATRLAPLHSPDVLPHTRQVQDALRQLSQDLAGTRTEREALARIGATAEKLQQEVQHEPSHLAAMQRLRRAGLLGSPQGNHGAATPDRSGSSHLQDMARRAPHASPRERAAMRAELQKMAQALAPGDPLRDKLQKAAQQLQKGHNADAAQTLNSASQDVATAENQQQDDDNVQNAESQLDLARDTITGQQAQAIDGQKLAARDSFQSGPSQNVQAVTAQDSPLQKGKGKGHEADFGKGSTLHYQKSDKKAAQKNWVLNRQAKGTSAMTRAWQKLYDPERKTIARANAEVKGQLGHGTSIATTSSSRGAPTLSDSPLTPDQAVYVNRRRAAEESLSSETVPPEYRDMVRQYFDTINPH
ncbi:MAG: hypothetical protein ACYCW6_19035 [Candidatus Xenobia bacterium]